MLLAIDTAGPNCSAAVARTIEDGAEIVAARSERLVRGHAERLFPLIGECLGEAGLGYGDLTGLAVTVGPGSFTGLRVGIAAARGLALGLSLPAQGIGVLDALLDDMARRHGDGLLIAALDAKRDQIYAAAARDGTQILPAMLTDGPSLVAQIAERAEGAPVTLGGSAVLLLAGPLAERGIDARILDERDCADVAAVARLAIRGAGSSPPRPLYLRGADAKPQTGKAVARA